MPKLRRQISPEYNVKRDIKMKLKIVPFFDDVEALLPRLGVEPPRERGLSARPSSSSVSDQPGFFPDFASEGLAVSLPIDIDGFLDLGG